MFLSLDNLLLVPIKYVLKGLIQNEQNIIRTIMKNRNIIRTKNKNNKDKKYFIRDSIQRKLIRDKKIKIQ